MDQEGSQATTATGAGAQKHRAAILQPVFLTDFSEPKLCRFDSSAIGLEG